MRTNDTPLIFILALSLLCLILIIMALPNWGQLQKSLDDPETIEEAIVRLIAAHNEEPEAHLEEGQSLHNHSHEAVIDHPEGSIPTDKYSLSEVLVNLNLGTDSTWLTVEASVDPRPSGLLISNTADDNSSSTATAAIFDLSDYPVTPTFVIFDFNANILRLNNDDLTRIGTLPRGSTGDFFDFSFEGEDVTGRLNDDGTLTTTDPLNIDYEGDADLIVHCRAIYDLSDSTITFYYNDQEIGSLSTSSGFTYPTRLGIDLTRSTNFPDDSNIRIFNLYISAGNY